MIKKLSIALLAPLALLACPPQQAEEAPAEAQAVAQQDTTLTAQGHAQHDCAEHKAAGHDCAEHKAAGKPCDCAKHKAAGHDCAEHKAAGHDCAEHKAAGEPCDCKKGEATAAAPGHAPGVEHDCGGHDTKLTHDTVTTRKAEDGTEIAHAGAPFGEAVEVSVVDLLSKPDDFAGKVVRVKGDITAMCHHKRGWFALNAGDQSGRFLRVLTAPTFLVPAGSIGKTGVAEGKVEVVEVAAGFAKHIAKDHKLGDENQIAGNVKQVVIRATGADFI